MEGVIELVNVPLLVKGLVYAVLAEKVALPARLDEIR
jgi:hypothetical protein